VLGTLARVPAGVKQVSSSARRFKQIPMSTACGQRCGNDVHLWGGRCGAFWTLGRVWAGALWKPLVHALFSLSDTRADPVIRNTLTGTVSWLWAPTTGR
jgi:hypothetical protein